MWQLEEIRERWRPHMSLLNLGGGYLKLWKATPRGVNSLLLLALLVTEHSLITRRKITPQTESLRRSWEAAFGVNAKGMLARH